MGFDQIEVELQDTMGGDKSIADSAWTSSYDKDRREERSNEEVERVIKFLAKHKHGTPFESVVFRFWIRCPIFCDRQIITHRWSSQNGSSARYRTVSTEYYDLPQDTFSILEKAQKVVDKESWKKLSENSVSPYPILLDEYYGAAEHAMKSYSRLISFLKGAEEKRAITNDEFKRAREIIRGLVPTAGMTERILILNLRSFANFMKLRNSPHAQPETRFIAQTMLKLVKDKKVCPIAIAALEKEKWNI